MSHKKTSSCEEGVFKGHMKTSNKRSDTENYHNFLVPRQPRSDARSDDEHQRDTA